CAVAKNISTSDAASPPDLGQEIDGDVVVKKILVDTLIRAVNVHIHQHARHGLHDDDPLSLHNGREPVLHDGDPVIHVQDGHVRIRARLEDDLDRSLTGTGGGGGHVAHVLHAIDGLLENNQ